MTTRNPEILIGATHESERYQYISFELKKQTSDVLYNLYQIQAQLQDRIK